MGLSKDWREFLELLNSRGVDYVIVGAQSLAFHGRPRHTGDLDILVRPTPDNARQLLDAAKSVRVRTADFEESDFLRTGANDSTRTSAESNRSADQHQWRIHEEAFATKSPQCDGIPVFMLGRDALIRNKRAVGRPQDLADLAALEA